MRMRMTSKFCFLSTISYESLTLYCKRNVCNQTCEAIISPTPVSGRTYYLYAIYNDSLMIILYTIFCGRDYHSAPKGEGIALLLIITYLMLTELEMTKNQLLPQKEPIVAYLTWVKVPARFFNSRLSKTYSRSGVDLSK